MPKISVHDLMTISKVLLLIIGQNDIIPKLLQPIVSSICKVMTVKKPCVYRHLNNPLLSQWIAENVILIWRQVEIKND